MSRLREVLDAKITVNLDAEIDRHKALISLVLITLLIFFAGYGFLCYLSGAQDSYYKERVEELRSKLRFHPDDRISALELALNLYLSGNEGKGINLAQKIYKEQPDDPNAMFYLGVMLSDKGAYAESTKLLEKLSHKFSGFEPARVNYFLGINYLQLKNYKAAERRLQKSVSIDGSYPVAYYNLGLAREKLGKVQQALDAYHKALKLNGNYPEAKEAIGRLTN
ncbi:tetratricopeptide repeat protein [Thermincola ferriacetica]